MRWVLSLALVLLLTTDASACNDCVIRNPFLEQITLEDPAKYRLIYTGIEGFLLDEYVRAISRKWADDLDLRYNSGDIDEFELSYNYRILNDYRQDYATGRYADKREHWWQYQSSWGPIRTYTTGPSRDVLNVGPFRVNSNFRFKLRDYEANLSSRWNYKFRPLIRVSTRPPFVRVLAMGHQFTYRARGLKLARITVAAGYNFADAEAFLEVQLELLNW